MSRYLLLFLALWSSPLAAAGETDPREAALRQMAGVSLRWDNVEGAPRWVDGAAPRYDPARGLHVLRLVPGGTVRVQLPPQAVLRLHPLGDRGPEGGLSFWVANGSGLYLSWRPRLSGDGRDYYVAPDSLQPRLVRITLAPQAEGPVEFALFVSRVVHPPPLAPYPQPVGFDTAFHRLRRLGEPSGRQVWLLEPGEVLRTRLYGPLRLRLESRRYYPGLPVDDLQSYRLSLDLDGRPLAAWDFEGRSEVRNLWLLDERPRMIGVSHAAFVEIPRGEHELGLSSSARVVLQARASRGRGDYLLPGLNAPAGLEQVFEANGPYATWMLAEPEVSRSLRGQDSLPRLLQAAERVARDNRRRDGGLLAALALWREARYRPWLPELRRRAEDYLRRYTYLRSLYPESAGERVPGRVQHYVANRLREPDDELDRYFLASSLVPALDRRLPAAYFVGLSPGKQLDYPLPSRRNPTWLRVTVLRPERVAGARLLLRFDDRPPLELKVADDTALVSEDRFAVTREQALWAWHARYDRPVSPWPFPALRNAADVELPLPAGVRRIRVEVPGDASARPLEVALQYRRSRPFRLAEPAYRRFETRLREHGSLLPLLQAVLEDVDTALDPERDASLSRVLRALGLRAETEEMARQLINDWLPVLRLLRMQRERFAGDLRPVRFQGGGGDVAGALRRAEKAMSRGEWLSALESWREVAAAAGDGPVGRRAHLAMVRVLEQLGEPYLAERLARSLYLFAPHAGLREQAYAWLARRYRQQGLEESLEGLLATDLLRNPRDGVRLLRLVRHWMAQGRYRPALVMGRLLGALWDAPEERLLADLKLRWWQSFTEDLATLPDPERCHYWLGWYHLVRGEPDAAREEWRQAGAGGESAGRLLVAEASLASALAAGEAGESFLLDWARLLRGLPGPRVWQDATDHLVTDAARRRLYIPALDLEQDAALVEPGRGARLRVVGPVRLRLDFRPVHPRGGGEAVAMDGWIRVSAGERHWVTPVNNNLPSAEVAWDRHEGRPGRLVRRELDLGPGEHLLTVDSPGLAALLRVYTLQPVLPTPLLPAGPARPLPVPSGAGPATTCDRAVASGIRRCGPMGRPQARSPGPAGRGHRVPVPPAARTGAGPPPLPSLVPLTGEERREPYARMVRLLWRLEQSPQPDTGLLAAISRLAHDHPEQWRLRALLGRSLRQATWRPVDYVTESAGIRYVERPAGVPESPALRVRAALLGAGCSGGYLLQGRDALVYSTLNLAPGRLRLHLARCDLVFDRPLSLEARLQLDDDPPQTLLFPAGRAEQDRTLRLGPGEHRVTVRIARPRVNQYLAVRIEDSGLPAGMAPGRVERSYQVATPEEPVRVMLEGPLWLRVDELSGGETRSRYLYLEPGWQVIELRPGKGRPEALYRLFQRVASLPAPRSLPRPAVATVIPVPAALVALPPLPPPSALPAGDDYPLGGQEDGTPALELRLVSRTRADDEEGESGRLRENFGELRAAYRWFDPVRHAWWRTELLARRREHGGPVLGLGGHLWWRPFRGWPRFHTRIDLSALVQRPGDSGPGGDAGPEWTVSASGRAALRVALGPRTYHLPSLTLFGRLMSLERNDTYRSQALDRDLFTRYKARHRAGLRLADTLVHRPWRDTEWYGRLALTSNAGLNPADPDNLDARLGWRQLLGAVELDAGYRMQHYFADADRRSALTRRSVRMELSGWHGSRYGLHWRLYFNHDFERAENSALFQIGLFGGNGRDYRDFAPGEVRFPGLRRSRLPQAWNRVPGGERP